MSILIKPIITEKATTASELRNCFTFQVNTKANKVEIKKAVEASYGVSVEKVRTINVDLIEELVILKQVFSLVKLMPLKELLFNLQKVIQ